MLATIAGFLSRAVYREYINANLISDFGLAEFLPSYFYVGGFSLLLLIQLDGFPRSTILVVTLASILFEFWQTASSASFEIRDVIASIIGGLTSLLIVTLITGISSDS